jgi:hypothetical protein
MIFKLLHFNMQSMEEPSADARAQEDAARECLNHLVADALGGFIFIDDQSNFKWLSLLQHWRRPASAT